MTLILSLWFVTYFRHATCVCTHERCIEHALMSFYLRIFKARLRRTYFIKPSNTQLIIKGQKTTGFGLITCPSSGFLTQGLRIQESRS
jgi:hypothetical protein